MTTQWGAPLTGAQMKLLRAAGLPDNTRIMEKRPQVEESGHVRLFTIKDEGVYYLPANHIAYTLLEAGWLDGRNVALWFGGKKAPDDLGEGAVVLLRDGRTLAAGSIYTWAHKGLGDVIAYTRKAEGLTTHADRVLADAERAAKRMGGELGQNELWKASPATLALPADVNDSSKIPPVCHSAQASETVTIAKMTEAEAMKRLEANCFDEMALLRQLGLIREPTRLERFWQAQPNGGAHVDAHIKAWVLEALYFEQKS